MPRPNPQAQFRLFCFSYAGGGVAFFSAWPPMLPSHVETRPIRLPGRENRLGEKPYTRVADIVPPLTDALQPYLDKPFAFFGHSLGGFICFETARELRRRGLRQPRHLFISGARAPQLPDPDPEIHALPEKEFIAELRRLTGTPEAVLQNPELLALLLPSLRADFAASETYAYIAGVPLDVSLTVYGGVEDPKATPAQLEGWREQTTGAFALHLLPGGHFFLHSAKNALLRLLSQTLEVFKVIQ